MKDATLKRLASVFLFVAAVLIAIALLAVRNTRRTIEASDWVNHTHAVIDRIDNIRNSLLRGEALLRAYAVTGETVDLSATNHAVSDFLNEIDLALSLAGGDPKEESAAKLLEIETLGRKHEAVIRRILAARQSDDLAALALSLNEWQSAGTREAIEHRLRQVKALLLDTLSEHDTTLYIQMQATRWSIWAGVTVDILLLTGAAWLMRDALASRQRATAVLAETNAQLETKVFERTAELRAANQQLSLDNLERQWANQALEHQLHYNHRIIECVNDLVIILTKAGNISRVNAAVLRHSGWDEANLIKQPIEKITRLATLPPGAPNKAVLDAMQSGRDLVGQPALALAQSGNSRAALLSLYPLRDQNKIIGGILTLALLPSKP